MPVDGGRRASSRRTRIRNWLGAPLEGSLRAAFDQEIGDTNRRRLLVLLPLMAIAHAIHVAVFRVAPSERSLLPPYIAHWREGVAEAHGATLVLTVVLAASVWRFGRGAAGRLLGPATAATYLVHGAVVAGIDQLSVTSVTPFIGYSLGVAVVVCLTPPVALLVYAIGLLAFVPAILQMQASPSARLAALPNGFTIVFVSVALSWMLYLARRRDFTQRVTIDEQRAALAELNVGLERRVEEQVTEIVERAREVEELNAQLHAKVRERSAELSMALARLAKRGADGALRRGFVLGDRFEILEMLGAGGMGAVYAGIDRTNGTRIAIKVIQASSSRELDALHRFIREAGTAAKIDHPAVVRMIHVDVSDDGMLYQVQELVEGDTLHLRLRRGQRWAPGVVARLVSVLCDALAAAHSVGVVHRDVKPANVMITSTTPGLKLLDFGISKLYDDAPGGEESTRAGAILGTPAFMAPEQMDGARYVSDRADVYAVGVTLFLLLTGRLPFEGATPRATLLSALSQDASDVRSLTPDTSEALARLVASCLEKEPSLRPDARALALELGALADDNGVAALEVLERDGALLAEGSSMVLSETLAEVRGKAPA
jgi:hypothetical protein